MPTPPTRPPTDIATALPDPGPGPDPGSVAVWRVAPTPGERSAPRVRQVLGDCLGRDAEQVALATGPHGRPMLAPGPPGGGGAGAAASGNAGPGLGFSASHAGGWLLVAVARGVQPGVDIEALAPRPNALAIARRYFTAAEAAGLEALQGGERERAFYRLWVAREAVLKAIGRGLAFGLDRLRIDADPVTPTLEWLDGDDAAAWQLRWLDVPEGCVGALAWRGEPRRIRYS